MQKDLEKKVNLKLLSDFIHCIAAHSDNKNAVTQMNEKLKKSIYNMTLTKKEDTFLSSHNLLYIGEFLVYHEEKGFHSIEDFRAIALALAYTKEFQHPSMFHDTQLNDFMKSIVQLLQTNFDVYLAVALYQLTPNLAAQNILLENIVEERYTNATDCIFSLMLYETQQETAELLNIMLPQLCRLFSNPSTLNIESNYYTYAFAIYIYQNASLYKKYPQGNLFQILTSLKEKRANLNSSAYQKLIKTGYTDKQIKHLNCILPTLFSNEQSLNTTKLSYVKNVVDYCKSALQSSTPISNEEQQLLSDLFWQHRRLEKRYDSEDNLLDATLKSLVLSSNENYIWLFTYLRNHNKLKKPIECCIFVADPTQKDKAEIYKCMTENEAYAVFASFLLSKKPSLKEAIKAFQECTGFDFLNLYKNNYQIAEDSNDFVMKPHPSLFLSLIEEGILSCSSYLEECKNNTLSYNLKRLLQHFLQFGKGKDILAFLEQFDNEIGIFKIDAVLDFSLYHLFNETSYNGYRSNGCNSFAMHLFLTSKRFSLEEKQELLLLLVKYSYYNCNNNCSSFIIDFLLKDDSDLLFSSKELKLLYTKLSSLNLIEGYYKNSLDKKFLPKKEYEQIALQQQEQKRREEKERKLANDNRTLERIQNEVDNAADKIAKLLSILKSYGYHVYDNSKKYAFINNLLDNIIQSEEQDYLQRSLSTILSIRQYLHQEGFITFEELMQSMNTLNEQLKCEGVIQ